MNISISAILLGCLVIFLLLMIKSLTKSNSKKQLKILFTILFSLMLIWNIGLFLQIVLADLLNIPPIYFDYIAYLGIMYLPVFLYFTVRTYINPKFKVKKAHRLLFIAPILSTFILWTNDFHHLFYIKYSVYPSETIGGPYSQIYTIYQYVILLISIIQLLKHSINKNHKITAQTVLFFLAIAIPLSVNLIGMMGLVKLTIYSTPISFTLTILCFYIAIFKFDLLNINTIALELIVNTIRDSYIVLNNEDYITGCNDSFCTTFNIKKEKIIGNNIFNLVILDKNFTDDIKISIKLVKEQKNKITIEKHFEKIDKYFSIDFSSILKDESFLGILVFFKDVTQKEKDKLQIKSNQELLIEQERLASLGQMVGGIAHNLKTPIFSISGGLEGLDDLINEFDESIEDDTVTNQDMHEIAKDMKIWTEKLKNHVSYMNDLITTVKGQAVTMSENQNIYFPVSELFQHVNILMQHEIKKKLAKLNFSNSVPEEMRINGNINSLVQVINNLISNAIEAYDSNNKEKRVDVIAEYDEYTKSVILSVRDFGPGLPEYVQEKLFKEMITTKGKNGTGLGLFMSSSNIKAHFNGNITYKTAENLGTTFIITIPINF